MGLPKAQISKYQHIMNCAARLISGIGKYDHVTPAMKSLHWLPSEARIHYKVLCLTYKAINELALDYLSGSIARYEPTRSLRSSEKGLLVVPKVRTKTYGSRAFAHAGPKLFNTLPEAIRLAPTYNSFRSKLKTHLFRLAYDTK